jgi:alkylation response protein AidB-like acyl-CoA dehydrogenase
VRFGLTDEQLELTHAVRGLVDRRAAAVDLRTAMTAPQGYDEELWRQLCDQIGVAALAVPEEYGGAGFTSFETHLVLERLGESLTPGPLLGSAVLATHAVLAAGNDTAAKRLLPGLADGSVIGALAWADRAGHWRTDGSDIAATGTVTWRLDGAATLVIGAGADLLLAVARTPDGVGIFEVDQSAGVTWTATPALDPTLPLATVSFDGARAEPFARDAGAALRLLRLRAATAVTALQVGGASAALDRTCAYLRQRHQFGRPLGSFQALKHRVADLLVGVESARSASWAAAWSAARDEPDLDLRAATAKAWCSQTFSAVAAEMIQLHGGIGITWEHDAHLYFKRAHATAQLFGSVRAHRRGLLEYL